ncbi:MAG: hypothetical protein ABW048_13200 [Sphingobium sp.]
MTPGTKLRSTVCDTEVMVIKCPDGTIECGGAAMAEVRPAQLGALKADFAAGSLMGKRYVDDDGKVELLCVRTGRGNLSVDGAPLSLKNARALPVAE